MTSSDNTQQTTRPWWKVVWSGLWTQHVMVLALIGWNLWERDGDSVLTLVLVWCIAMVSFACGWIQRGDE